MIIGILGKMGAGKTTSAEYIVKNYNYEEKFFSKKLKEMISGPFKFTKKQLYDQEEKQIIDPFWGVSPREVMQFIGTDLFRKQMHKLIPDIGENFWIKVLERELEEHKDKNFVISDCRSQNEVDFVKSRNGFVFKIVNTNDNQVFDKTILHETEANIDKITNYDLIIVNDGSKEELYKKIDDMMYSIINEMV